MKKSKKPKTKLKLKPKRRYKPERKKYDIWSTRVQEDVLAETLNSCDVSTKDRSRSVESYDYTLGRKYYNNELEDTKDHFKEQEFRKNNKRTRDDRKNTNFKPQRRRSCSRENVKGSERNIMDLVKDENCGEEDLAKDIANKLYEEKEDLICEYKFHMYRSYGHLHITIGNGNVAHLYYVRLFNSFRVIKVYECEIFVKCNS